MSTGTPTTATGCGASACWSCGSACTSTQDGRRSSPREPGLARGPMTRGRAIAIVAAACVLPRLVVLIHERGVLLSEFVEKSDQLARTFIDSGTFGFVPGEPSASTQPLYGWFLIPVY